MDGRLIVDNGKYYVEIMEKGYLLPLPESSGIIRKLVDSGVNEYHIGFRPNNVRYTFEKKDGLLKGTVYSFESIGNKAVLIAKIGDKFVRMIAPNDLKVRLDQAVYVELPIHKAIFFDAQTTRFIGTSDEAAIYRLVQEQLSKGVQ